MSDKMTSKERIDRSLRHKYTEEAGLFEHFWDETVTKYVGEKHIRENENLSEHFGLDMDLCWCLNTVLDCDFRSELIAEDEETRTVRDGNYAIMRTMKHTTSTPEHIGFSVTCYDDWKKVRDKMVFKDKRIRFDAYRKAREEAKKAERFFCLSGKNVFECLHSVAGHENLLIGMALEPDWVAEMANDFADLILAMMKRLFEQEGLPDGVWFYEDLGFKERPFMSPAMYSEMISPAHKKINDYLKSLDLPIVMHSCGYVAPLIPHFIEEGIDCLQAMEVKAGMDVMRISQKYSDSLALMGGLDIRVLESNDKNLIDKMLSEKLPALIKKGNYVVHSDHSVPPSVEYDTLCYYFERVRHYIGR